MGGHSDKGVEAPISADRALAAKLTEIVADLRARLAADFASLLGVSLPDPAAALVLVQDYALVSTERDTGDLVAEYEPGATTVLDAQVTDPVLHDHALAVARSVLEFADASGGVSAGGCVASAESGYPAWVAAVICEVGFGARQDWGTPVEFFVLSFAFVVWQPPPAAARARLGGWTVAPRHWPPTTAPDEREPN